MLISNFSETRFGRGGDILECADIESPFKLFWMGEIIYVSLESKMVTISEESSLKLCCISLWLKVPYFTFTQFENLLDHETAL